MSRVLTFEAWCEALERVHKRDGKRFGAEGVVALCGADFWRERFDDGQSPDYAYQQEAYHVA